MHVLDGVFYAAIVLLIIVLIATVVDVAIHWRTRYDDG